MEWFEQACTVICTIISSLQTIITASLSTPCQSKPVSAPVKCHMNRVKTMILHQNHVILGIVYPSSLPVCFQNLTNINVILIMMITINCFWWLKKKLVNHWMNTHEGYTFLQMFVSLFCFITFLVFKTNQKNQIKYECKWWDKTSRVLDFVWIQQVKAFYQTVPTCQKRIPFIYIHSRINNHFFIQWYM